MTQRNKHFPAAAACLLLAACAQDDHDELFTVEATLVASESSVTFVALEPGRPQQRDVVLRSVGLRAVVIDSVTLNHTDVYETAARVPAILQPGEEIVVTVFAAPVEAGDDVAELVVQNDSDNACASPSRGP